MISSYMQNHPFWGTHAPLSTLISAGLILMASSRTAFALVILGALVWVYGLTVLICSFGKPIFPKKGKRFIWVVLSSFLGSIYLLLFYFISPSLAMETGFLIILVPLSCIGSKICERTQSLDPEEAIIRAILEALVLGALIIAMALIREPWGFGTLSVPGGPQGIMELFNYGNSQFFPVQIISGSAGGLFILGYGLTLFRRFRNQDIKREDIQ
jgi:hypothetical protein